MKCKCRGDNLIVNGRVMLFEKGNVAQMDVYCPKCEKHYIADYHYALTLHSYKDNE